MLWNKLFSQVTPYQRTMLVIEVMSEGQNLNTFVLPTVRSAVFFLAQGDTISIKSIEELNDACYLDYQLIESKEEDFHLQLDEFKKFVIDEFRKGKEEVIINVHHRNIYKGKFLFIHTYINLKNNSL